MCKPETVKFLEMLEISEGLKAEIDEAIRKYEEQGLSKGAHVGAMLEQMAQIAQKHGCNVAPQDLMPLLVSACGPVSDEALSSVTGGYGKFSTNSHYYIYCDKVTDDDAFRRYLTNGALACPSYVYKGGDANYRCYTCVNVRLASTGA